MIINIKNKSINRYRILKISVPMALLLLLANLAAGGQPAFAQEDLDAIIGGFEAGTDTGATGAANTDDVLDGFDDPEGPVAAAADSEKSPPQGPFSLDGYLKIGSSINVAHDAPGPGATDWRDLSRLRGELQLELHARFSDRCLALVSGKGAFDAVYAIKGRHEYTEDVLDAYEDELELRETYVLLTPLDNLDIKVGRQIVVWGKSDNIRVTDVLNPLDLREPGLTDIEDLRRPVAMTRADVYLGNWSLTGMALHEIRFNKTPVFGHDFFPYDQPLPPEKVPSDGGGNTEFAVAVSGTFSGWDIAFYGADIYDDTPHLAVPAGSAAVAHKHARLEMFGVAANLALGNFLLKAEAAHFSGLEFFNAPSAAYTRIDALAGFEYSGFHETTVSFEAALRHINGFDDALKRSPDQASENEFQTALRVEREFLNDTLKLTFLALTYGPTGRDGALQRFSAAYDLTDAVEVTGGAVLYQSGDLPALHGIGDNDRLFMAVKYSF